jgi:SAM-dependent methyltransferase
MHWECLDFLGRLKRHAPAWFRGQRVLEVGALDVNGSARQLFSGCRYLGVDARPGRGVQLVGRAHELPLAPASFDVVLSTETLEHDAWWRETLAAMARAVRPGGLVVVTAAAFGRPPHGVEEFGGGHYRNLAPEDLRPFLGRVLLYEEDRVANDLRAAWLAGDPPGDDPCATSVPPAAPSATPTACRSPSRCGRSSAAARTPAATATCCSARSASAASAGGR